MRQSALRPKRPNGTSVALVAGRFGADCQVPWGDGHSALVPDLIRTAPELDRCPCRTRVVPGSGGGLSVGIMYPLVMEVPVRGSRLLALAVVVPLLACEGPEGPQGEQGLQGEPGGDGEDGAPGTDGQDGTPGEDLTPRRALLALSEVDGVACTGNAYGNSDGNYSEVDSSCCPAGFEFVGKTNHPDPAANCLEIGASGRLVVGVATDSDGLWCSSYADPGDCCPTGFEFVGWLGDPDQGGDAVCIEG